MTLRQLKKYLRMSKEQLISFLYDYVDEHQSNEVININQSLKEYRQSEQSGFMPVQMHINANDVYISYYKKTYGFNGEIQELCDNADKFTLGELEFIINLI